MELREDCLVGLHRPIGAPELVPTCYGNVNPLIRQVTASEDTIVVAVDSSGLALASTFEELRRLLQDPGFIGLADRPYEITVEDGVVTRIVAQVYETA